MICFLNILKGRRCKYALKINDKALKSSIILIYKEFQFNLSENTDTIAEFEIITLKE